NRDGKADLVVPNTCGDQPGPACPDDAGSVSVYLGDGEGCFGNGLQYPAGSKPTEVAVADFHGRGAQDLALSTDDPGDVLLSNGDGTFRPPIAGDAGPYIAAGPHVLAADFNHDGFIDVAMVGMDVSVFLGNGNGQLSVLASYGFDYTAGQGAAVADFDGDGNI